LGENEYTGKGGGKTGAKDSALTGRLALVTGGAKRIGRVLALTLAECGVDLAIHYRGSAPEAENALAAAQALGVRAALVQGDLADPDTAAGLIDLAADALGPPDILINNASIFEDFKLADTTGSIWDRHQAVNLRAPFLLSRAFRARLPADRPGDIINLNDYRALRPGADHFAYTISKVGLHGLTRSLALALAPRIRVNELALGAVLPPAKAGEDYMHMLKREIPTARFSTPTEVAEAMLLLLRNRSLTGQTICIDGGRHLV
jgi:NAD(P)-dependent dehydrogenase (short-subunit alcohol dehydrogenase family)